MSQLLAPRPSEGSTGGAPLSPLVQRARKISTACLACKQRKTKVRFSLLAFPSFVRDSDQVQCSGGEPCEACAQRNTSCIYDASSDQRRKIANQKNVQDLALAQEKLDRHQELLGGVLATVRVGSEQETAELLAQVRSGMNLSQLAAHVRNAVRSNVDIQSAYDAIDFTIDGGHDLPSPHQILSEMQAIDHSSSNTSPAFRRPYTATYDSS